MARTVYLDGRYLPAEEARLSIFDRAVTFGDAIYEVTSVLDGKLVDFDHHADRYFSSLDKLGIPAPLDRARLLAMFRELVARNALDEGLVYLQVSRGVAEREFLWPDDITPTAFAFTQVKSSVENAAADSGVTLASTPDLRWARRDIKSVNLLAQVMARQAAREAGAYEALMIDPDGSVTECSSTSFYLVRDGVIVTRPLGGDILPGVTRRALLAICRAAEIEIVEKCFALDEALAADEAFITGATTYLLPVIAIDGRALGDGAPGPVYRQLRDRYIEHVRATLV